MSNTVSFYYFNSCLLLYISMFFPMTKSFHSKRDYFNEKLIIEDDKLNGFLKKSYKLKKYAESNFNNNGVICYEC